MNKKNKANQTAQLSLFDSYNGCNRSTQVKPSLLLLYFQSNQP